jgi:pimeloyl-ACP methyl ester carboxylesterase
MLNRTSVNALAALVQRRRKSVIAVWALLSILVLAQVLLPLLDGGGSAEAAVSYYARSDQQKGAIVFVHGVMGDARSTWTNTATKANWPELIKRDRRFDGYNIYVFGFPTPAVGRSYSVDELADHMRLVLGQADVLSHTKLIFVCHSMGGLITRALLLKYRELLPKVGFLYFFSTPTTGSEVANVAALVSQNPQFRNMFPMGENTYIESLQSAWLAARIRVPSYCAYERLATNGLDVVTRQSATNLCTEALNPVLADHISIVKPSGPTDVPYLAFAAAFDEIERRAPVQ